jgi:TPR repeat protein
MIHKYLVTLLVTALSIGSPVYASNLEQAEQLIMAEQYSEAIELIFSLAKSGDINAQLRLAKMYYQGQGLEKNYDKASYWVCRASETDNFMANKFRIKISLSMISEDYQPKQCSSILDIVEN